MAPKHAHETSVALTIPGEASKHIAFTGVGLTFEKETTFDQWKEVGIGMAAVHSVSGFALGDWLNFGEGHFDKKQYKEAVAATGLKVGTLRNMASVSKRFPIASRRLSVSFEHHRLLAPVKDDEKVSAIMDRVEEGKLSANAMKELLPPKRAKKLTAEKVAQIAAATDKKWRDTAEEFLDYLAAIPVQYLPGWAPVLDRIVERCNEVAPEAAAALEDAKENGGTQPETPATTKKKKRSKAKAKKA